MAGCVVASDAESPSDDGTGDDGVDTDTAADTDTDPDDDVPLVSSVVCEDIASPLLDPPEFYEANPLQVETGDNVAFAEDTPESQGFDATLLESAAEELADLRYTTSLLVLRNDVLVMERYFNDAEVNDSNAIHSSSKSMLALLTGVAIEEGFIESRSQPVSDLLPELFDGADPAKQAITVEHLLTMSAGFKWREDISEYTLEDEPDWLQAIVDLELKTDPGEAFNYSTAQSHLLGAAITEATGMSLCDYAHTRLFDPIGIEAERWGRDPQGYFSAGYNVYMTPRELAQFGQLVLHRGQWDEKQVVPSAWVDDAVSEQIVDAGNYWYGYLFWLWRPQNDEIDIAWGYGGQLVYSISALDLVVVITTNTRDYNPDYDGTSLVRRKIMGAISP